MHKIKKVFAIIPMIIPGIITIFTWKIAHSIYHVWIPNKSWKIWRRHYFSWRQQ